MGSGEFEADVPKVDPKDDAFKRYPFAKRVAELITSRHAAPSAVIGIYGAWGEGKTTVLEYIRRELDGNDVLLMPFNPWRFGTDEQLLRSFFSTLAQVLKAPLKTTGEKVAEWISNYGELVIPSVEVGWGAAKLDAGGGIAKVAERFSTVELETLKTRIESALSSAEHRVLVVMDDIDRLDRNEIHQLFKLIKLTANFSYVDYLVAFDDTVIAAALAERYGEGNLQAGRDYLEKIIQIPLRLPAASEMSLRKFYFAALNEVLADTGVNLAKEDGHLFGSQFANGFELALTTPRMALRYANVLRFALPVVKDEVNVVDFMLLEAVRLFYPNLQKLIRERGLEIVHAHLDEQHERTAIGEWVNSALNELGAVQRSSASGVLRFLFPQLESVFGNMHYGSESREAWATAKRLCSTEYFTRYFTYSVSDDDISDAEIGNFIRSAIKGKEVSALQMVRKAVDSQNSEAFLQKLWRRTVEIESDNAEAICWVISQCGEFFSDSHGMFGFTPSGNAARLVEQILLLRISDKHRAGIALRIVEQAQPLYLAMDCLRQFSPSTEAGAPKAVFTEVQSKKGQRCLANRIREELSQCVPWEKYPDSQFRLLRLWARVRNKKETEAFLRKRFKESPDSVLTFLEGSTGKAYPLGSKVGHPQDFESEHLPLLRQVIDPKIVYQFLQIASPQVAAITDYYKAPHEPMSNRIAAQFAAIYSASLQVAPTAKPEETAVRQ
jgi:predicted KAP-like P-loop ATPase